MKTTSPADHLPEIPRLMRDLAPDDPRTLALELAAWQVGARAVGVVRRVERELARD